MRTNPTDEPACVPPTDAGWSASGLFVRDIVGHTEQSREGSDRLVAAPVTAFERRFGNRRQPPREPGAE